MNWISVKDKMPEEEIYILVFAEEGVQSGRYRGGDSDYEWAWTEASCCSHPIEKVTHWMLFPEPPKD